MEANFNVLKLLFKFLGVAEYSKGSNPTILNWIRSFFPKAVDDKDYSWCSIGLISILSENDSFKKQIKESNVDPMARSWMRLPYAIDNIQSALPGDIVILTRGTGLSGHVAIFLSEDFNNKNNINLIGCNQSDSVSIASFKKDRIIGIRRLLYEL